jgi:hypothetical protein
MKEECGAVMLSEETMRVLPRYVVVGLPERVLG